MTHKPNIKYKDRLFRAYFGAEENRDKLLSLYNALNDSNYDDPDELEINTLEDVIYMNIKNDVSFIVGGYMTLYEHQSSINPNMPFRGLCYFAKMYEKYRIQNHMNMFSSKLQKIPTPQYYVFYNGRTDIEDKILLRLSDAFIQPLKSGEYEWTATMININSGRNVELMDRCRPLYEYSVLIAKVRERLDTGMELADAVDTAVSWCIDNDIMVKYLRKHREEVSDMWLTEFDEEEYREAMKKEIRDDTTVEHVEALVESMKWSVEEACKALNITIEEYEKARANY